MPTKQQLIDGLRKAYEAGDIAAANEIASFIDAGRYDKYIEPKQQEPIPESMTAEEYAERYGDEPDIYGLIKQPEPKPEASFGEKAIGAGEAALSAATGATAGTAGMIAGTLRGFAEEVRSGKFGTNEAADRIENYAAQMASELTYEPRTEKGREYVQELGELGAQAAPLAGLGGELAMIGQTAGRAAAPQIAQTARATAKVAEPVTKPVKAAFKYQSPAKQRIAELLEAYDSSTDTARYRLSAPSADAPVESRILRALGEGRAKIQKDPIAINAINQGFDEGIVAMIKGASPADRAAMSRMVDVYERGTKDALFRGRNRAQGIVGERLTDAYMRIRAVNRQAGKDIDTAAQKLRGQKIDITPVGDDFIDTLSDMGVQVSDDFKLSFKGSDIEGIPAAERIISKVFERMTGPEAPDAYELHRLKRFIDEQVTYGKTTEGLTGRSERALKGLRSNINKALGDKFSDYREANAIYADTIDAIDTLQKAAGKNTDLSGANASEQLGTLMRRALSNAQSRATVIDMAKKVDEISNKYSDVPLISGTTKGRKPDIMTLVMFSDELDSRFGPSARTSLQGQAEQVAERGRRIAQSTSPTMAVIDEVVGLGARAVDKARGVSDEKAIDAIRKLVTEEY